MAGKIRRESKLGGGVHSCGFSCARGVKYQKKKLRRTEERHVENFGKTKGGGPVRVIGKGQSELSRKKKKEGKNYKRRKGSKCVHQRGGPQENTGKKLARQKRKSQKREESIKEGNIKLARKGDMRKRTDAA